jgi:hypothetical protein
MKWVRKYGNALGEIKNEQFLQIIKADEMHSYIGSKTTVGYGLQLIKMPEKTLVSLLRIEAKKQGKDLENKLNIGQKEK